MVNPTIDEIITGHGAPAAIAPPYAAIAAILSSIDDHLVCFDREWRYTYVNDAAARTLGLPREALIGRCIWSLFPDAIGNQFYRELHEAAREARVIRSEHYYAPMDRWFDNHVYPHPEGVTVFSADITSRKRAEVQLRRQATIFENQTDAVIVTDLAGLITEFNPAAERMLGYAREEVIGRSTSMFHRPEEAATLTSEAIAGISGSGGWQGVITFVRKDGTLGTCETVVKPITDGEGRVVGALGFNRDITERTQAEAALAERERRFRATFDNAAVGMAHVGMDGRWLRVNDRICEITGYEREELLASTFMKITHPDDLEEDWSQLQRLVAGEVRTYTMEKRYLRRDGAVVPVEITVSLAQKEGGEPDYLISVVQDISARRQAEEALALERERLAIALRAGKLGVYEWVVGESAVWWSPEVYPVYGVDPSSFVPTLEAFGELVHPDDREGLWRKTRESIEQRKIFSHEYRVVSPDGEVRWVANISKVAVGESGEVERITGVAADVTERKEADRRKDDFLAMLAHELRNPLAPVRNAVHILRHVPPEDPRAVAARDVLDRQTAHMSRLVDELLDVSRVTRGKIRLQREPFDMAQVIRDTVEDYRSSAAERGLSLRHELPPAGLFVEGDRTRLAQVMGNLLSNALKFTDRGGTIRVRAWADEASATVVVEVRDDGVGMDAAVRAHLFEPFTQADRSLDRSSGGLGLGLALVKGLVELHGGTVGAESEGPAKGSSFTVRVPMASAEVTVAAKAADPAPGRALRVVVIEDNRDAAESLVELLRMAGHEASCAHDGRSGIALARGLYPDVVLCDIGLPGGMDGYAVARALRAQSGPAAPRLVALTGYGQEEDLRRAREAGFDDHLVKPAEFPAVIAALGSEAITAARPALAAPARSHVPAAHQGSK